MHHVHMIYVALYITVYHGVVAVHVQVLVILVFPILQSFLGIHEP